MANTIAIVGPSGSGKSTGVRTLDPKSTLYINADGKTLPFRGANKLYNTGSKNYIETSKLDVINPLLERTNKRPEIKDIVIDTANGIMLDLEMSANFRNRKAGGEALNKWMN